MKRHSQNGVALVISLIMLSVVTFMAIAFLALSRRERSSVTVTVDQTTASFMAEAALAHAQSEMAVRMRTMTNTFSYDMFVSTNMIDPNGFVSNPNPSPGNTGIYTNVNFDYINSPNLNFKQPLNEQQRIENIGRLLYAPRVPVYVRTNFEARILNQPAKPLDFRYFVDFNRDGRFEPTGWQAIYDYNNKLIPVLNSTGTPIPGQYLSNYFVGDPQWIGMLEKPGQPYSARNKFVGRYAFLVLPEGKSLDLNLIHNQSKPLAINRPAYYRNQGVGPWEMNLAAFLCDLNTNLWPATNSYFYNTNLTLASSGLPFLQAMNVVSNRGALSSVYQLFGTDGENAFKIPPIDGYSDGPAIGTNVTLQTLPATVRDNTRRPWPGSEVAVPYTDIQQLLTVGDTDFTSRLIGNYNTKDNSTYSAYTFYRALAQLGVNSPASSDTRIHLNYKNIGGYSATNFVEWSPKEFFTTTAERLFRTQLDFNDLSYKFGSTNIPIWPTNYYNSTIHRMLQLAANIYDATTNRIVPARVGPALPTVFRPIVDRIRDRNGDRFEIIDYEEETNTLFLARPWRDLSVPSDRAVLRRGDMVYGVPLIIGAKKGYPNFNEFVFETRVEVSRKLKAVGRPNAVVKPKYEQMYVLGISNSIGLEAWNSYAAGLYSNGFPRKLELRVTNFFTMSITNRGTSAPPIYWTANTLRTNITIERNKWLPKQYLTPINTNFAFLRDSSYNSARNEFSTNANNFAFDPNPNFPVPKWGFAGSNRLVYILLDVDEPGKPRVVDFVNIKDLTAHVDIESALINTNADTGETGLQGSFWSVNPSPTAGRTEGIDNQLRASMGKLANAAGVWRNTSGDVVSGLEREKATDKFLVFLGLTPMRFSTSDMEKELANARVMQAPFSPSRTFFLTHSWQANDPLVHYTVEDLIYPMQSTNVQYTSLGGVPDATLGAVNRRYQPWGDTHNAGASTTAIDLSLKDPGVFSSDDWEFPTNKFASIGLLGRVHRGTPWQTIYMKSKSADMDVWSKKWALQSHTHPTNDYRLFDLFTTAPSPNASRGLLSINQTNIAAWSAALSGVSVLTRTNAASSVLMETNIQPSSPQLLAIVESINASRTNYPWQGGTLGIARLNYQHLGDILSAPALTVQSPYLPAGAALPAASSRVTDREYERIPEMVLSLLKADEPRMVVYTFGQALAPLGPPVIAPGTAQHLMYTNYQIAGEVVTKHILRVDGPATNSIIARERFEFVPNE